MKVFPQPNIPKNKILESTVKSLKPFAFGLFFTFSVPFNSYSSNTLIDSAVTSFHNKEYQKALEYCDEISKQDSLGQLLLHVRGFSAFVLGRYDSAVVDYTTLLRLKPKADTFILKIRGASYMLLHEYDSAISDFSRSIKIDPTSWESFQRRGLAHKLNGDYELAIQDYDQALTLMSSIPDIEEKRSALIAEKIALLKGANEPEDSFSSGAAIKIVGIFAMVLFAGIIKTVIKARANSQKERLNELLKRVPKSEFDLDEDELVDKFNISTYEGLWQDLRGYKAEEQLTVELYRQSIGFSYRGCEARLKYNQIDKITLFTASRGRYDAITDTYLKLDFNHEKLVETVRNEHYSEFLEQIGRIRIRKSNQPLKGELNNLGFERIIEQILKDLGDYPN